MEEDLSSGVRVVLEAREEAKLILGNSTENVPGELWVRAMGVSLEVAEKQLQQFDVLLRHLTFPQIREIALRLSAPQERLPSRGCIPALYLVQLVFILGMEPVLATALRIDEALPRRLEE
ncbi:MAG: hypothetical protein PHS44_02835 [Candidatus Dojkabacteria bacterium]|nr:hypothetical protein [Candidatus Dojkabacteria bacterium]